jgi:hypothetical protein
MDMVLEGWQHWQGSKPFHERAGCSSPMLWTYECAQASLGTQVPETRRLLASAPGEAPLPGHHQGLALLLMRSSGAASER